MESSMVVAYAVCLLLSCTVIHHVSDYEFSSVLTLSVFFQTLAFVLIALQIDAAKSVAGVSAKSMALFAVSLAFRLCSTLVLDGYLPLDRTGDVTYRSTYAADEDTVNVKNIVMYC